MSSKDFNYLERTLKAKDLSWRDFASSIGESPQTVYNWKQRGIPGNKLRDVALALGISQEELEEAYLGKKKITQTARKQLLTAKIDALPPEFLGAVESLVSELEKITRQD